MTARRVRVRVAMLVLAAGLALSVEGGVRLWRTTRQNAQIAALSAGQDVPTDRDAPDRVLVARARFLVARHNLDGAEAIADRLAQAGGAAPRAALLYALGNAHMRQALTMFKEVPFRLVAPVLAHAKAEYRQAMQLDPGNWDARYNYTLAAALVRDTESAQPTAGDEMSHERAAWPDIPGAPNGMP